MPKKITGCCTKHKALKRAVTRYLDLKTKVIAIKDGADDEKNLTPEQRQTVIEYYKALTELRELNEEHT